MQTLDRQCEKFMGGPTVPYSERVHATIDAKGKIFINGKLHQMMGRPTAVYLYYNRPKNMIVLEPTQCVTAANAFTLKPQQHGGSRVIYANPFCKHFGIRITAAEKFIDPATAAAGCLYLKLTETVTITVGPRKRKKRTN